MVNLHLLVEISDSHNLRTGPTLGPWSPFNRCLRVNPKSEKCHAHVLQVVKALQLHELQGGDQAGLERALNPCSFCGWSALQVRSMRHLVANTDSVDVHKMMKPRIDNEAAALYQLSIPHDNIAKNIILWVFIVVEITLSNLAKALTNTIFIIEVFTPDFVHIDVHHTAIHSFSIIRSQNENNIF